MTDQEEAVVPLDQSEHLVGGGGESDISAERAHERGGDHGSDAVGQFGDRFVTSGRQQEQRPEVGVVLSGERPQGVVEPVAGFVHHHHGHDRRRRVEGRSPRCTEASGADRSAAVTPRTTLAFASTR